MWGWLSCTQWFSTWSVLAVCVLKHLTWQLCPLSKTVWKQLETWFDWSLLIWQNISPLWPFILLNKIESYPFKIPLHCFVKYSNSLCVVVVNLKLFIFILREVSQGENTADDRGEAVSGKEARRKKDLEQLFGLLQILLLGNKVREGQQNTPLQPRKFGNIFLHRTFLPWWTHYDGGPTIRKDFSVWQNLAKAICLFQLPELWLRGFSLLLGILSHNSEASLPPPGILSYTQVGSKIKNCNWASHDQWVSWQAMPLSEHCFHVQVLYIWEFMGVPCLVLALTCSIVAEVMSAP